MSRNLPVTAFPSVSPPPWWPWHFPSVDTTSEDGQWCCLSLIWHGQNSIKSTYIVLGISLSKVKLTSGCRMCMSNWVTSFSTFSLPPTSLKVVEGHTGSKAVLNFLLPSIVDSARLFLVSALFVALDLDSGIIPSPASSFLSGGGSLLLACNKRSV